MVLLYNPVGPVKSGSKSKSYLHAIVRANEIANNAKVLDIRAKWIAPSYTPMFGCGLITPMRVMGRLMRLVSGTDETSQTCCQSRSSNSEEVVLYGGAVLLLPPFKTF